MVDNRPPLHVPLDLRRRRALDATSMIMQIVGSYVGYDRQRRCADEVYKHLYDIGVELITDEVRAVWGLPPRGPEGTTQQELHALEAKRFEAMTRPLSAFIVEKKP